MRGRLALKVVLVATLSGALACGVVDIKRPGPPPPCSTDSAPPAPAPAPAPTLAP